MWKLLAPVFVLAVAIGWAFPRDLVVPAAEPAEKAHHYVIEGAAKAQNVGSGSIDAVELERQPDGHFYS